MITPLEFVLIEVPTAALYGYLGGYCCGRWGPVAAAIGTIAAVIGIAVALLSYLSGGSSGAAGSWSNFTAVVIINNIVGIIPFYLGMQKGERRRSYEQRSGDRGYLVVPAPENFETETPQ